MYKVEPFRPGENAWLGLAEVHYVCTYEEYLMCTDVLQTAIEGILLYCLYIMVMV